MSPVIWSFTAGSIDCHRDCSLRVQLICECDGYGIGWEGIISTYVRPGSTHVDELSNVHESNKFARTSGTYRVEFSHGNEFGLALFAFVRHPWTK